MPTYTAFVTILAVLFYFSTGAMVAKARTRFGVKAPAITGQPDFERVFRAQMNTLEWMPVFLPLLWLCAIFWGDRTAAAFGLIWIAGRIAYVIGYSRAAEKRELGFMIQTMACLALLIAALAGIVPQLIARG